MWQNINGWHALIIVAVVVLVFGASRLPALAEGLGESLRILRGATREGEGGKQAEPGNPGGKTNIGDTSK